LALYSLVVLMCC